MTQLWVGNTVIWKDEESLMSDVKQMTGKQPKSCWFAKDKSTGTHLNYGFLVFASKNDAAEVIRLLNGTEVPNSNGNKFKLGWGNTTFESDADTIAKAEGFSCYVGGLPSSVKESELLEFFKRYFPNAINARLIRDEKGNSKGYGFIKFNKHQEVIDAIQTLNNVNFKGHPLKVKEGTQNRVSTNENNSLDVKNTTLFITNIDPDVVKEETLLQNFHQYGNVLSVKIDPNNQSWATVVMETHTSAESAKNALSGSQFGGTTKAVIEWGKAIDDAPDTKQTIVVPILNPPKISKKKQAAFFNEENTNKVVNIMRIFSEQNRQKPLEKSNPIIANRMAASSSLDLSLQYESCLYSQNVPEEAKFWYY